MKVTIDISEHALLNSIAIIGGATLKNPVISVANKKAIKPLLKQLWFGFSESVRKDILQYSGTNNLELINLLKDLETK